MGQCAEMKSVVEIDKADWWSRQEIDDEATRVVWKKWKDNCGSPVKKIVNKERNVGLYKKW